VRRQFIALPTSAPVLQHLAQARQALKYPAVPTITEHGGGADDDRAGRNTPKRGGIPQGLRPDLRRLGGQ